LTLILTALLAPLLSSAATPGAPPKICVDANCVNSTTTVSTSPQAVKWHPGTYVWYIPRGGYRPDKPEILNQILSFIDSIGNEPSIKGVQVVVYWAALEGDTAGDYARGFAAVDALLARVQKYNKYLMLSFQSVVFGNFAKETDVFPAYLINNYGTSKMGYTYDQGRTARTWQKPTGDRVIALSKAYGERYNKHPNFEMITMGETALQVSDPGFSNSAVLEELKRYIPLARSFWPNTNIRIGANWLQPDSLMVALYDAAAKNYLAVGGPDVFPAEVTQADRVFVGLDQNHNAVYKDYRELLPWAVEVQWQSYSGQFTLDGLWNSTVNGYTDNKGFVMPSINTRYLVWYVNEANGNASTQWKSGILPYIRSKNGAVSTTACPKLYPACKTN
jgi:hypothetical protein